ncbi:unnamed protein product [Withania somnifera]
MSTKSKSTRNGTPSNSTPVSPRIRRVSRGVAKRDADSPSLLQNSRPVDRSVRSAIPSKSSVEQRTSKLSTLPDEKPTRIMKPSELQAELNVAQEDLKKAKEMLALVEKEKVQALEEVKEAQKLAEEANEKLREASVDRKQAEDNSEIEMFRAVDMEQVGIEAAQKKEEEWQKEVEAVRNQHAVDVAALLSTKQELQRVMRELAMACEAKNQALSNAEDAAKIAETHAEKVEILSAELVRLKSLLDSRSSWNETEMNEKISWYEGQLVEKEAIMKQLNADLEAAKMAESYAHKVLEEWKKKIEELNAQAEEARHLERSASATLESIAYLEEKVGILEMSMVSQKSDLEDSEHHAQMAREEASELRKKVDSLMYDLETLKEETIQAMENEKLVAALEEKKKDFKKAMESLASALHEVSSEAREAKERLLSNQTEHEHYETQLEDLKLALKATEEKYESMLDEAKEKLDVLTNSIEQSKDGLQKWKAEWEEKELHLISCMNKTEEENASMEKEINRLVNLLEEAKEEASAKKDEEAYLKNSLKKSESEVTFLKEVLGEAKDESMRLKERLTDRENEVQNFVRENEDLLSREAASLKKVEELSMLLEESLAKNETEASGELSDSQKDYSMLTKKVKFSDQMEKPKMELPPYQSEQPVDEKPEVVKITSHNQALKAAKVVYNSIGKLNELENKEKENDNLATSEHKMWEREAEQEEKLELKADGKESYENGGTSPTKQQNQKKKKPLFHKFGNLMRKKSTSSLK